MYVVMLMLFLTIAAGSYEANPRMEQVNIVAFLKIKTKLTNRLTFFFINPLENLQLKYFSQSGRWYI